MPQALSPTQIDVKDKCAYGKYGMIHGIQRPIFMEQIDGLIHDMRVLNVTCQVAPKCIAKVEGRCVLKSDTAEEGDGSSKKNSKKVSYFKVLFIMHTHIISRLYFTMHYNVLISNFYCCRRKRHHSSKQVANYLEVWWETKQRYSDDSKAILRCMDHWMSVLQNIEDIYMATLSSTMFCKLLS